MKAIDLIEMLSILPPETEIVMETEYYSIEHLDKIRLGVYKLTDYGNDFFPYEGMTMGKDEVKAVLLIPAPKAEPEED